MMNLRSVAVIAPFVLVLLAPTLATAATVQALFDLDDHRRSPFPSDRFTIADVTQNTGRRVNLPKPDCGIRPSDCDDLDVINTLDGFNVQPRLSIPFDGAIDVASVSSQTVFIVRLESTLKDHEHDRHDIRRIIGINQIVWDVATNTLHAESDEILDQHTSYALIVTRGVRDIQGHPVEAAESFQRFRYDLSRGMIRHDPVLKAYRKALLDALAAARHAGVGEQDIATASVFTTQSVTATVEKIRDAIKRGPPPAADFAVGPGGTRAVYPFSTLTDLLTVAQTGTLPSFTTFGTTFPALFLTPTAVGTVAFGKYVSPDYLTPDRYIPSVGTRLGEPAVQGTNEIFFNLVLPAGAPPAHGWPVAIYAHGGADSKEIGLFLVAGRLAVHGIATIGINIVGRGFGPLSTLTVVRRAAPPISLPAGGRAVDINNDGQIAQTEGVTAPVPRRILWDRDTKIQTVADLMQLVRVIESGIDADGDGVPDLDSSRIYFLGRSLGGMIGTVFLSVEPTVRAGVLVSTGGPTFETFRLGIFRGPIVAVQLAARIPSLINLPGIEFNENMPLRNQPPLINTIAGAMEIQEFIDNSEWVGQAASPVPYGAYLRRAPLPGVEPKSVILAFPRGDRTLPNPTETAILRAGDLADRATYYRWDLFLAENPTTPPTINDPHLFNLPIPPGVVPPAVQAAWNAVAFAAQDQAAIFLASDGVEIIDPDGPGALFETPIIPPLPEDVVFFP